MLLRKTISVYDQKGEDCILPENVFLFDDNAFHEKQLASNSLSEEEKFERKLEQLEVLMTDKKMQVLHFAFAKINQQLNDMVKQAEAIAKLYNSNINLQPLFYVITELITPICITSGNQKNFKRRRKKLTGQSHDHTFQLKGKSTFIRHSKLKLLATKSNVKIIIPKIVRHSSRRSKSIS